MTKNEHEKRVHLATIAADKAVERYFTALKKKLRKQRNKRKRLNVPSPAPQSSASSAESP